MEVRPLTFGEKACGVGFNPGGDPTVQEIKKKYAEIVDLLNDLRTASKDESTAAVEKRRMYSVAITEAQTSQMWAVKAATWSLK